MVEWALHRHAPWLKPADTLFGDDLFSMFSDQPNRDTAMFCTGAFGFMQKQCYLFAAPACARLCTLVSACARLNQGGFSSNESFQVELNVSPIVAIACAALFLFSCLG